MSETGAVVALVGITCFIIGTIIGTLLGLNVSGPYRE